MTSNFIKTSTLVTVSCIISLTLLEASLQAYHFISSGQLLSEENKAFTVGFTKTVKDRRKYSLRDNYHGKDGKINTNKQGFREPSANPSNTLIVCLGDSVPFGAGVSDHESYPARLNDILQEKHSGFSAVNAGVPSYNLRQSIDRFKFDVLTQNNTKNIKIVTLQAANDISLLSQYRERWNEDVTWTDIRFKKQLQKKTNLATLYYLRKSLSNLQEKETHTPFQSDTLTNHTVKSLQQLQQLLDNKTTLILMPIDPFYYHTGSNEKNQTLLKWKNLSPYAEMWKTSINKFNDTLESFAHQNPNIYFFDTRKIIDMKDRNLMYIDFIHYTPAANRIIATELHQFIRTNKLITDS